MNKTPIKNVMFTYNGDDEAFRRFLRSVVHDYINSNKLPATSIYLPGFPAPPVVVFGANMRVWLYYRLSRDEDGELNSLTNQRQIIYDYAVSHDHEIVGESCDDNVSGMHFEREGIKQIYPIVEDRKIDAVLVKDLSRLGRHKTQTALFIDYLRANQVRVLSATENIDTFNDDDDLVIGFKQVLNDYYAKDGSRRVCFGFRQKQKKGLVMIPPFGYFKDKNTGQVVIIEETAAIVRQIFDLYISGHGFKAIARILNQKGVKSPGYYQEKLQGKRQNYHSTDLTRQRLWVYTAVKRVLTNEFYAGTLVCHKSERSSIKKTHRLTSPEEQYRHEGAVPAIISQETWQQAQFLLNHRTERKTRAGKGAIHRYTGLLQLLHGSGMSAQGLSWPHQIYVSGLSPPRQGAMLIPPYSGGRFRPAHLRRAAGAEAQINRLLASH